MIEWFLFLPQLRLAVSEFVQRAMCAEDAGFDGVAFIDHLEAPGQRDESIWEAMSIATWVAAKTSRLRVGHLVLCDAFRHPAVLAKEAVTLSAASGAASSWAWVPDPGRLISPDSRLDSRIRWTGCDSSNEIFG